jgi:hypothetical protein
VLLHKTLLHGSEKVPVQKAIKSHDNELGGTIPVVVYVDKSKPRESGIERPVQEMISTYN